MKKIILVLLALVVLTFSSCKTSGLRTQEDTEKLYKQFMSGEITAIDENGEEKAFDSYVLDASADDGYTYTFYDMTGDGGVEVIIKKYPEIYFFTEKDGNIYHWYTDTKAYSTLLNNGALLYERKGAGPTHTDYEYYELDENAKVKFSVTFSQYDQTTAEDGKIYPDTYFLNEQEVTKEEYEAKTKDYLLVGSDKIVWYDKAGNQVK